MRQPKQTVQDSSTDIITLFLYLDVDWSKDLYYWLRNTRLSTKKKYDPRGATIVISFVFKYLFAL